jgi:hypothetical protein
LLPRYNTLPVDRAKFTLSEVGDEARLAHRTRCDASSRYRPVALELSGAAGCLVCFHEAGKSMMSASRLCAVENDELSFRGSLGLPRLRCQQHVFAKDESDRLPSSVGVQHMWVVHRASRTCACLPE